MNRDELIMQWQEASKTLAAAKEAELALRQQIVETQFDAEKMEGTENVELGNGYKLQCVKRLAHKLDAKAVDDALAKLEATGDEGRFVSERLVKFKPELSVSEYKKLSPAHKKIIDKVVTVQPATPSLKLVEPKA